VTLTHRRLPHWRPDGKALFIAWHLHGSLPHNRFPPAHAASAGKAFVWMDRALDEARFGPSRLRREELAQTVVDALRYAAGTLHYFDLHAFAVMPNHVHVLIQPLVDPSKLLQSVKWFSAREANKRLGRSGEPFWQRESYDHWFRNEVEFERVRRYIEENPVRAGLVARAEDYLWSSAHAGANAGMAG
jgi:REP element-mobilizing transposase RayT